MDKRTYFEHTTKIAGLGQVIPRITHVRSPPHAHRWLGLFFSSEFCKERPGTRGWHTSTLLLSDIRWVPRDPIYEGLAQVSGSYSDRGG